jgi:uncharacterized protein YecE (DUF72 family)
MKAVRSQRNNVPLLTLEERRARRQERREKQREINISRAAKMHAQRLAHEKEVELDFKEPKLFLRDKYLVGCSGWFYWHWRGLFYPEGMPTSQWFDHYAKNFRTVELNAPFYSWPTLRTVQTWKRQAAQHDLVYTIKVSELITHVKRFNGTKTLVRDFGLIADLLGDRMGCFLFQLPPSYHYTPGRLKSILGQLDHSRRNVVEFRHRSWWNEAVFKAFRKTGTTFCSCSGPGLPDDLIKTADDIYIRFHGTKKWYRHDYSTEELQEWTKKIRKSKAKRAWIYFNNDREGYALRNARELIKKLKADIK